MKQVIVMRTDLGMSVGKMCAQAAHACQKPSEPTIVVQVGSAEEFVAVMWKAQTFGGVTHKQVKDAGHTEVPPGTLTCGSVYGPDARVDAITGALKLL